MKKYTLNKIYACTFLLIFIWIFLNILLNPTISNYYNPFLALLLAIIDIVILLFSYRKMKDKFENISNKKAYIYMGILLAIMVVFQFVIGYLVRTDPSWDLGIVIKGAKEVVTYGHLTEMAGYFKAYPNNIGLLLILSGVFKVCSIFHLPMGNAAGLMLNITVLAFSMFLFFKLAKRIFGNFNACFLFSIAVLFIPFYAYAPIYYTDTLSMFLPLLLLYLLILAFETPNKIKKILYFMMTGLMAFLAKELKVTSLIIVIAFFMNVFFDKGIKKGFQILIVPILIIMIVAGTLSFIFPKILDDTKVLNIKYSETKFTPYTHWVMMGLTGVGGYSDADVAYTFSFDNYEKRSEATQKEIVRRLKKYGPVGYIKFLTYKATANTWGSGTYDFEDILNSYKMNHTFAHEFLLKKGQYFPITLYYTQTYHIMLLFFILMAIFYTLRRGKYDVVGVLTMSVFGVMMFLFIWETRSRYMINYIPIYFLVMMSGFLYFENTIREYKKKDTLQNKAIKDQIKNDRKANKKVKTEGIIEIPFDL